jgi:hypothetical protein
MAGQGDALKMCGGRTAGKENRDALFHPGEIEPM